MISPQNPGCWLLVWKYMRNWYEQRWEGVWGDVDSALKESASLAMDIEPTIPGYHYIPWEESLMLISYCDESEELTVIILGNMPKSWQSSLIQSLTFRGFTGARRSISLQQQAGGLTHTKPSHLGKQTRRAEIDTIIVRKLPQSSGWGGGEEEHPWKARDTP